MSATILDTRDGTTTAALSPEHAAREVAALNAREGSARFAVGTTPTAKTDPLLEFLARSATAAPVRGDFRGQAGWENSTTVAGALGVTERKASAMLGAAVRAGKVESVNRRTAGVFRTLWRIV